MTVKDLSATKLERVSDFVANRKEMYQQELSMAETDVERFVWAELISLLDSISAITEDEGL
jgi:hypothetical protein